MTGETKETLLELDELKVYFYTEDGVVKGSRWSRFES